MYMEENLWSPRKVLMRSQSASLQLQGHEFEFEFEVLLWGMLEASPSQRSLMAT